MPTNEEKIIKMLTNEEKMLEDLKKCPSGSLRQDLTKQTLEERFNEKWLASIANWLVENGWKKSEVI